MIDAVIVKPEEMRECAQVAAHVRHTIHAYPEVGLNLTQTEKTIVETLKSFGCEAIETRVGGADVAGVVCVIKGDQVGRLNPQGTLTRAEMAVILHRGLTL